MWVLWRIEIILNLNSSSAPPSWTSLASQSGSMWWWWRWRWLPAGEQHQETGVHLHVLCTSYVFIFTVYSGQASDSLYHLNEKKQVGKTETFLGSIGFLQKFTSPVVGAFEASKPVGLFLPCQWSWAGGIEVRQASLRLFSVLIQAEQRPGLETACAFSFYVETSEVS